VTADTAAAVVAPLAVVVVVEIDPTASVIQFIQCTVCPVKKERLEIISTQLRRIGIPPPTVAPWRVTSYKDRQSNRRVGVF